MHPSLRSTQSDITDCDKKKNNNKKNKTLLPSVIQPIRMTEMPARGCGFKGSSSIHRNVSFFEVLGGSWIPPAQGGSQSVYA